MKKILIMLSMCTVFAHAQLKPKIAISYNFNDQIKLETSNGQLSYYYPKVKVRSGLEYQYKKFSVYYDMRCWCRYERAGQFSPEQASFDVGLIYRITDKIKVTINHECYHPLSSDIDEHSKVYGGYQGITFSYGY